MLHLAFLGLLTALALALPAWVASLVLRDASLADRLWSLFIAGPVLVYAYASPIDARGALMLVLLLAWALRLALYIGVRNWGHGEDRRYRDMRARNEPNFGLKSVYLVFGLQGFLAWIVGWPLLVALAGPESSASLGVLDVIGALLAAAGLVMEAVADAQLARFRRDPAQAKDAVMDRGLWAWSRHPNYFGESCVWWGLGLMALSAQGGSGAWCLASPLMMTVLLLKVSGVSLLEQDIGERRPGYRDYVARTSAFIPWPPRRGAAP